MKIVINALSLITLLALPSIGAWAGDVKAPAYTLVEAEDSPKGEVVSDPSASGGKYVKVNGDYQPVEFASLPKTGDSFVVWVRVKGTAVQLKGIGTDGKQKELNWIYDTPADFTWESFGRHTRDELGTQALIIRGPDPKTAASMDCLIFSQDDSFDPKKDLKTKK